MDTHVNDVMETITSFNFFSSNRVKIEKLIDDVFVNYSYTSKENFRHG